MCLFLWGFKMRLNHVNREENNRPWKSGVIPNGKRTNVLSEEENKNRGLKPAALFILFLACGILSQERGGKPLKQQ